MVPSVTVARLVEDVALIVASLSLSVISPVDKVADVVVAPVTTKAVVSTVSKMSAVRSLVAAVPVLFTVTEAASDVPDKVA